MGLEGRYIDALSDEQRDNVIEAEDFGYGQLWDYEGRGCLVAVAENLAKTGDSVVAPKFRCGAPTYGVGHQFDRLIKRFGKDRIVRLCKERAATGNRLHEIRAEIYEGHRDAGLVPMLGINGRFPEDLP